MAQLPPARPCPSADQAVPDDQGPPADQHPPVGPQPPGDHVPSSGDHGQWSVGHSKSHGGHGHSESSSSHGHSHNQSHGGHSQSSGGHSESHGRVAAAGHGPSLDRRHDGGGASVPGLAAGRRAKVAGAFGGLALVAVAVPAGVSFAGTDRATVAAQPPTTQADNFQGVDPRVPSELDPPAGNVLHSVLKARGVQIYQCRSGAWALLEPAASLTGVTMHPVKKVTALHYRGPSWQSDQDGSLVEGDGPNAVRAPSEHPNSIPQLLVESKVNRGSGLFGKVTYIQRLDTVGGLAPAGACTGSGTTASPYRAVYRFFVAKP